MQVFRLVVFAVLFALSFPLEGAATTMFSARVKVALCPSFAEEGIELRIKYSIGDDPNVFEAAIVSQSINVQSNKGTFQVYLPATYGRTPIHVFAHCVNAAGVSSPSNSVSISNCDVLAAQDQDGDGLADNLEDTDCSNSYNAGDPTNAASIDTDGDGMLDMAEIVSGTDPRNPGSNPRPNIFSAGVFDPDGNGDANPIVWRPANGTWYLRDFFVSGNHLAVQFGLPGDIPFTFTPNGATSNVGVIRNIGGWLHWLLREPGFRHADGSRAGIVLFGLPGDQIIPGPWETPGVTNPAVVRFQDGAWQFYIYLSTGGIRVTRWGVAGDVPKVQDYDGDGLFDIAVYRPKKQIQYIIRSQDQKVRSYHFGSPARDHSFRGDTSGDGTDDITFWNPLTGMFQTMVSDNGFNAELTARKHAHYYAALQLGLYGVHVPLSWNRQNGQVLYTVVDHASGYRYYREENSAQNSPVALQWGLAGDFQG